MITSGSGFWMDDSLFNGNREYKSATEGRNDDLIKMASVKRAIANFVRIVTGENIPVKYSTGDNSLTNGKQVMLSGNCVKEKNFDAAVGLALHEGSHIKYTDFKVSAEVGVNVSQEFIDELNTKYNNDPSLTFKSRASITLSRIEKLANWVEDRRIDFYIYSTAPGYKCYYKAMYKRYFESPFVDKGLESGSYRKEEWESYKFRIYNIVNPKTDLKALKNLRAIYELIDLAHIGRLKSTHDSMEIAVEMYKLIEEAIPAPEIRTKEEPKQEPKKEKKKIKPSIYGYTAKGLPFGIIINKRTGKLAGTTSQGGSHKVIITSHMADGSKMRKRITIEV